MSSANFETLAVRTQTRQSQHREHSTPLYLTSSFTFDSAEHGAEMFQGAEGNLYSRFSNPNTTEFIQKLALMEGYNHGVATASGMAAVYTALTALLQVGDHVVAASNIFGNSLYILQTLLPKMGVECTFVEVDSNLGFESAIRKNTKILFVETPANPTLKIADLQFLGDLCAAKNITFIVDNCFATPYLQKPFQFGAHLVLHSATKYIDGQGRVLGGAILGEEKRVQQCYDFIRRTGAALSPFNAWVLSKSLETLALRMDRHCQNAQGLLAFLDQHPDVVEVHYPHHADNPQLAIAQAQMSQGGGLVGCILKGGRERSARFLNALKLHSLTANLGDTRSIATHPSSTTHSKLTEEAQRAAGIDPGFIRFSVGLEHVDDILSDVEQALKQSRA
ncbi:aminotransferase class I/II-fold pyridoxal phosphate-dependent enzyme [Cryomorphaceae bacterium]|nr:aminotransferase class I/II-fold pyridoxal phosphate-dependent enzyme [Cryomorphaceae bacterium]